MSGKEEKLIDASYSDKEAQKRFDAALKGALKTPHKPLKEKPPAKTAKPKKLKPVKKA